MLLPAWQLHLLARCWPSPDAAEGQSSSTGTFLGVHSTDTAPANSPSAPAAPGQICGAVVDLEPSPLRGRPGRAPAILAAAPRPVPFVPALIAALPREPGCFYLGVRAAAAAAAAGGLRGWGPPASVQTSSGCEHNSQGPAFEKQGDAGWPPWGTSKVRVSLHCRKSPCV